MNDENFGLDLGANTDNKGKVNRRDKTQVSQVAKALVKSQKKPTVKMLKLGVSIVARGALENSIASFVRDSGIDYKDTFQKAGLALLMINAGYTTAEEVAEDIDPEYIDIVRNHKKKK